MVDLFAELWIADDARWTGGNSGRAMPFVLLMSMGLLLVLLMPQLALWLPLSMISVQ